MFTLGESTAASAEIEVKRSRFIADVTRVSTEQQARDQLTLARATYPDARHHCSAFVISAPPGPPRTHSNDDGEPSGTAGRPMLDVLLGAGLQDVSAVVTRYFGGTLLGTGGLARAYSQAVSAALASAPLVEVIELRLLAVSVSPAVAGRVESELRARDWDLRDANWAQQVTFEIAADTTRADELASLVASITRSRPAIQDLGPTRVERRVPRTTSTS